MKTSLLEQQSVQDRLATIATNLTSYSIKNLRTQDATKKTQNKRVLRQRAQEINKILEQETIILYETIRNNLKHQDRETQDKTNAILKAIAQGDEEIVQEYGISFAYAWGKDMVKVMVNKTIPLEVQTIAMTAVLPKPALDSDYLTAPFLLQSETTVGIKLAQLFRKLSPVITNMRIVIDLNEFIDLTSKRELTKEERDQYVIASSHLLERDGVIGKSDIIGKDFYLHRESIKAAQIDLFLEKLRMSNKGQMYIDDQGYMYFKPKESFIEALGYKSQAIIKELHHHGILLKHMDGKPTKAALFAAGFLDPLNKYISNILILDRSHATEQDIAYMLLRSIDMVEAERYHSIFFDSQLLDADLISYGIGKIFQKYTQTFIESLDSYNDWSEFDSYEYAERNYDNKGEILPEDKFIIKRVVHSLKQIGIAPQSLKKVADVGSGPNLYPALLLAPYLHPEGKFDLLEFSSNRTYLTNVINGTIDPDHAKIWSKFEQFMIAEAGELYKGAEKKAKEIAKVQYGNIFELPKGEYDLISSYFCAESIVDSHMPFREALRSLADALNKTGLLFITHMVGSEGYMAGQGTHFPAVNLTVEEIKRTYIDIGLEIISFAAIGHDDLAKVRDGYQGMALLIAHPKASLK